MAAVLSLAWEYFNSAVMVLRLHTLGWWHDQLLPPLCEAAVLQSSAHACNIVTSWLETYSGSLLEA